MKRLLIGIIAICSFVSVYADNADSVRFVNAKRDYFKLGKGAVAYQTAVEIFGARRVISVIKFSPKRLTSQIVSHPSENITTRQAGESRKARFAINGGFPQSFELVDGVVLGPTAYWLDWKMAHVDGLLLIYDDRYDIVGTKDAPNYEKQTANCRNALATGPVLIEDGVQRLHEEPFKKDSKSARHTINLFRTQHPRSVVGIDKEGFVYFIVVDGRHKGKAKGLSMDYLTKLCGWMGMHEAINLDGGGSSTLWTKRYGVLNYPCDNKRFDHEGLRRVRNHIVVK